MLVSGRLEARLNALASPSARGALAGSKRGIEKESLRVTRDGYVVGTPHPPALGSALTNRYITTDYSEALLEFVTPPVASPWAAIQLLCDIHQFVYSALDDELLWALSMPCLVRSDADIPLARYGTSNIGTMKTVYRRGLGYRYGRFMQAISGVHFNYSLAESFWPIYRDNERSTKDLVEFRSQGYLALVRNVRRLDWLLLYLFGASPAVCKSFLRDIDNGLDEFDSGTLVGPYSTSLRMSDIGYQNTNQASLHVSANTLDEYIRDLRRAVETPNPEYERIGVKVGSQYRQLSANQLQIENEFYSTIRPKRVARSGERPTAALRRGGVEYVELRALDVSPFDPVGINQAQVKFMEVFLVYCLLLDSPPIDVDEQLAIARNHASVARRGREPGLELARHGRHVALQAWAAEISGHLTAVAEIMEAGGEAGYVDAVRQQLKCAHNPDATPSGRLLNELRQTGQSLFCYGMELSRGYRDYFCDLAAELNQSAEVLRQESRQSIERQRAIEAADMVGFDEYLERYFS